jgi:hypothetical protein
VREVGVAAVNEEKKIFERRTKKLQASGSTKLELEVCTNRSNSKKIVIGWLINNCVYK